MRVIPSFVVGAIVTVTLVGCGESTTSPSAVPPSPISKSVAADFPVAQATIWVLPGFTMTNGLQPGALNDSDEVVGTTTSGQPFKWTAAHGVQNLPASQFQNGAVAIAVNDNGEVLGGYSDTAGTHPAVWLPNGTPRVFPSPAIASTLTA